MGACAEPLDACAEPPGAASADADPPGATNACAVILSGAAVVPPTAPGCGERSGAAVCSKVWAAAPDHSNGGAAGMTGPTPATEGSGAEDGRAAGAKGGGHSSSFCCSVIFARDSAGEGYSSTTKLCGDG